jgi:hypothetical protein
MVDVAGVVVVEEARAVLSRVENEVRASDAGLGQRLNEPRPVLDLAAGRVVLAGVQREPTHAPDAGLLEHRV